MATTTKDQLPHILEDVDRLYESNKMREALEILEPLGREGKEEEEKVDVLWRLTRLCYKVSEHARTT